MRVLSTVLYAIVIASGFAQGIVNFNNSVLPEPPNRKFYNSDGVTPLAGTNFVAQLYYGRDVWTLRPATNRPAPFRPALTGPGLWLGGNRILEGFPPGSVVTMMVAVWDSNHGSTPEEAAGHASSSRVFTYIVPEPNLAPTNYYMYGFVPCDSLACCSFTHVPEFDQQPQSQTVLAGSDVTLFAQASPACFGDWRFNGTNSLGRGFVGAGTPLNSLVLRNVQSSRSGNYQLLLGSYAGFVTSQVAVLTVINPMTPPRLSLVTRLGDEFRFYVPGATSGVFAVETTTDLGDSTAWLPIHTNIAPFWFTNSTTDADRQRFYRAVLR